MFCGIFLRFRTTVEKRTFYASSMSTRVNGGIAVAGSHFTSVCARWSRRRRALCVSSTTADASRRVSSGERENPPKRRGVVGDVAARNALKVLQSGSAACKDPAALGILLALNFCWLSVGWCRFPESVLAHAQKSMSLLLCVASQCLSRCGR
ncbi:hypothetical protein TcG_11459 [Trypanosoma cruzi]|nr:hypothetical protein TcG_11459 [Trypanosoma cruzi]